MSTATDAHQDADPDHSGGGSPVVEVTHTVDAPVARVWQALASREGAEALLGAGAALGGKGEPWHSEDGPRGVVRSYHPQEQLRVSWHETPDAPATIVELDLREEAGATRIDLRHERLADAAADRSALASRWGRALERLGATATSGG